MKGKNNRFPDTSWSLVRRLRSDDAADVRRALDELCLQYYYPLYCYIRRRGLEHHDAQDALHGFLTRLLHAGSLADADESKGHLRSLLTTALQRFLANWERAEARREYVVHFDTTVAEARYEEEQFSSDDTPDRVLERKWAHELMQRVLQRLREDYQANGKGSLFDALQPVVVAGGSLRGHDGEAIAQSLNIPQVTLRVSLSRLLKDYREVLHREVSQTVTRVEDVDAEIDYLRRIFQRG